MNQKNKVILYLVSWYPDEEEPNLGIFIKRHAESVSQYCEIIVLYTAYKPSISTKVKKYCYENNIHTYRQFLPIILENYKAIRFIKCRFINRYIYHIIFFINNYKIYSEIINYHGKPDLIHVNVICTDMTNVGLFALFIKFIYKIPYIITEHDTRYLISQINFSQRIILRIIMKFSSRVITISNVLKNALMKLHKSKFTIIPNVVDTNFFIINKSNFITDRKVLLHVSLLNDEQKNISGILRSVQKLRLIRKDFELKIIGEGKDLNKLKSLAANIQNNDEYIYFLGNVTNNQLVKLYQQSDLFILNSNFETFGCVLIEAIACGTPVISTRCGGPEEIITVNNGLLIDVNNDDQLTKSIDWVLNNQDFFDKNKMRSDCEIRYSYKSVGQKLSKIYYNILDN